LKDDLYNKKGTSFDVFSGPKNEAAPLLKRWLSAVRQPMRILYGKDLVEPGNDLVSNVKFSPKELSDLEADMNKILSKIQLQLMDKYEHYKKKE
jgi:hypothetical protein